MNFKFKQWDFAKFTVETYSPMSLFARVIYVVLVFVAIALFTRYAVWWFSMDHLPDNWGVGSHLFFQGLDFALFGVLSFVVFIGLFLKIGTWFAIFFIKRPKHINPQKGLRVAFVTCYVPGKEPIQMLERTLVAMKQASYAHDTWVLDEGNSNVVKELCKKLDVYHFSRRGVQEFNLETGRFRKKTKAGNLNAWRFDYEYLYDIVAQLDMDHVPRRNYLERTLGYFRDASVGFVGVPQIYKNTENWIARGAGEQTHFFYGPLQQGFYGSHMPFLIGTTHVYRVAAMREFGGYSPTIAEDYLTGMHFFSHKWKGIYVPEIVAEGEGPTTWSDYFSQQMRWSYGLFEILFKHYYKHFFKLGFRQKINITFSQMFYFSGLAFSFGVLLTIVYLLFGVFPANMALDEWMMYSFPAYLSAFLISVFLHQYYIDRDKEPVVSLLGGLLGQAASIVYTIAFFKFVLRGSVSYSVTPKGNKSTSSRSLRVFVPHIAVLLILLISLEASFFLGNDSVVMRFWAVYTVLILVLIIFSDYFAQAYNSTTNILTRFRSGNETGFKRLA